MFAVALIAVVISAPIDVDWSNVDDVLNNTSNLPVFMLIWSPWCAHCKVFKPEWEKLAEIPEWEEKIIFARLNCEAEDKLCRRFNPGKMHPRLLWIDQGGSQVHAFSGHVNIQEAVEFVHRHFREYISVLKTNADVTTFVEGSSVPSFMFNVTAGDKSSLRIITDVATNLRYLDVKFGIIIDHAQHKPRVLWFDEKRKLGEFNESMTVEGLTRFVKVHALPFNLPYNEVVRSFSQLERMPVCMFMLNVSDKEERAAAVKLAFDMSSYVVTSHSSCLYNREMCRYFGVSDGSVIIANYSVDTYWVHKLDSGAVEWGRRVSQGRVFGSGPGDGPLKDILRIVYELRSRGDIVYYGFLLAVILTAITVPVAILFWVGRTIAEKMAKSKQD